MRRDGARIILNISSSPFWREKRALRAEMLGVIAKRHKAFVAMVNQVGGNDSLIFDGSSLAIAPGGEHTSRRGRSFAEDLILFDTGKAPDLAKEPRGTEDG